MLARTVEAPYIPEKRVSIYVNRYLHVMPLDTDMHQAFEISMVLSGRIERHCDELVLDCLPGDLSLNPGWEPHGWRVAEPETGELVLHFLPEFLGDAIFDNTSWLSLFAADPRHRPRAVNQEMRAQMLAIGRELASTAPGRTLPFSEAGMALDTLGQEVLGFVRELDPGNVELPPAWEMDVRLGVLKLLLILYKEWDGGGTAAGKASLHPCHLSQIAPALKLTMRGPVPLRRINMAEAAYACSLSVAHFGALFRRVMGLSFGKFEMRNRLANAAHWLLTTDSTVETIAHEAGFVDSSHLSRSFSRYYSKTPARYREEGRRVPQHPPRHIPAKSRGRRPLNPK
ncbi:MAG: AraC family transcriptional regulator [Armatimonadota bacterium]|nr:MAG: AraC family transcriptional regulator [Armatimonadota bacterium]